MTITGRNETQEQLLQLEKDRYFKGFEQVLFHLIVLKDKMLFFALKTCFSTLCLLFRDVLLARIMLPLFAQ